MKKVINAGGYRIERYINRDKVAAERWGKVWFKFRLKINLLDGCACVSCLHSYLPEHVMKEVEKTWKKDFINA